MLDREEQVKLGQIRAIVGELEGAVRAFETVIGKPIYVAEGESGRFKYSEPSPQVIIVLKAVRVVSGLNALVALLEVGHTVEMGMIIRSVDDFLADMMFVLEALETGKPTADQQRFIEEFLAGMTFSVEEMMATYGKDVARVSRQKIQASEARVLGKYADGGSDRMRRVVGTIDAAYSGYVHGSYASTMELYEGGDNEGFMLKGTFGSPHIRTFLGELARYAHRSLNIFAGIAHGFALVELAERLLAIRKSLDKSPSFQDEV